MAETAEQVYARISAAADDGGHLPMPPQGDWDVFPWTVVDGAIAPRTLPTPSDEPKRHGESGDTGERPCGVCAGIAPERLVWDDERWTLSHSGRPSGLPVVLMLQPREHLDYGQFDDDLASEHGRICNRLVRIAEALPHVGRCHVQRIGDGGAHAHTWFLARTARLTHVLGSPAAEWDDIIPPGPEDVWRADLHVIATKLSNWGGDAHA